MYADHRPCDLCGSEVRVTAQEPAPSSTPTDGPVGPADGVVGTADEGPDVRTCTNPACPSNA